MSKLYEPETGDFALEASCHYDEKLSAWLADVLALSPYRGKGRGREDLRLLCEAAEADGGDFLRKAPVFPLSSGLPY